MPESQLLLFGFLLHYSSLLGGKQTLMITVGMYMCTHTQTYISVYIIILFLCCYWYLMCKNQGEGHCCRSLNDKGKEGVAFASNETMQELRMHLTASGNHPKVVIVWFFSWMCCWPLTTWLLKAFWGRKF